MKSTFQSASSFRGSGGLDKWNTQAVTDMHYTFYDASAFLGVGIYTWDVAAVRSIDGIFTNAGALLECTKKKIFDGWHPGDQSRRRTLLEASTAAIFERDTASWSTSVCMTDLEFKAATWGTSEL